MVGAEGGASDGDDGGGGGGGRCCCCCFYLLPQAFPEKPSPKDAPDAGAALFQKDTGGGAGSDDGGDGANPAPLHTQQQRQKRQVACFFFFFELEFEFLDAPSLAADLLLLLFQKPCRLPRGLLLLFRRAQRQEPGVAVCERDRPRLLPRRAGRGGGRGCSLLLGGREGQEAEEGGGGGGAAASAAETLVLDPSPSKQRYSRLSAAAASAAPLSPGSLADYGVELGNALRRPGAAGLTSSSSRPSAARTKIDFSCFLFSLFFSFLQPPTAQQQTTRKKPLPSRRKVSNLSFHFFVLFQKECNTTKRKKNYSSLSLSCSFSVSFLSSLLSPPLRSSLPLPLPPLSPPPLPLSSARLASS